LNCLLLLCIANIINVEIVFYIIMISGAFWIIINIKEKWLDLEK